MPLAASVAVWHPGPMAAYRTAPRRKVRMNQTRTLTASIDHRHWWTHRDAPGGTKVSVCACGEQRDGIWWGDTRRS
jgi:hypothetical protein